MDGLTSSRRNLTRLIPMPHKHTAQGYPPRTAHGRSIYCTAILSSGCTSVRYSTARKSHSRGFIKK